MFAFDKPLTWVIILLIVIVLFGASKLPEIGKGLGRSINEFKSEMNSSDKKTDTVVSTVEPIKPVNAVVNGNVSNDEVVITRRERTREDGTVEIVEERVVRKQ